MKQKQTRKTDPSRFNRFAPWIRNEKIRENTITILRSRTSQRLLKVYAGLNTKLLIRFL